MASVKMKHRSLPSQEKAVESPKDAAIEATGSATIETTGKDDSEVKEDITLAVVTKDTQPIDSIPMDERKRFFIKILKIIRQNFREYFGLKFANQWGHFVEKNMCKEIHQYADWLEYQDGDHVLDRKANMALGLALSSDGCYLFIGYEHMRIIKWNMLILKQIDDWRAHRSRITRLNYQRGLLISGCDDGEMKVWNGYTNQPIHTLKGHKNQVNSIELNRSGSQIISSSNDRSMRVWSIDTGECLREIKVHSGEVRSAYLMDNNIIISGSWDESIKITDLSNGKELRKITDGITDFVYDMSINSNGSIVACLCMGITIYSWPEMKVVRSIDCCSVNGRFHPINPDILAVDNFDSNAIEIYNVKTGERIRVLEGHSAVIYAIRFTPDGTRIVSNSLDFTTRIWDVSGILILDQA